MCRGITKYNFSAITENLEAPCELIAHKEETKVILASDCWTLSF